VTIRIKIGIVKEALNATVLEGEVQLEETVEHIYASDLMSDVLAFGLPNSLLLTGLATKQAVISAHMAEFKGVVFLRGKCPKDGADIYARDKHLVLLSTKHDMYDSCLFISSALNEKHHESVGTVEDQTVGDIILKEDFTIGGRDFANAGMVSTEMKEILKKIGFPHELVRRVAISTYEGELNVIMHASRGKVQLLVSPKLIEVVIEDEGPGIPDIALAMQEGFTTATEEMRALGFGSGMGLPNIKRNTSDLNISSEVGKGTIVYMKFQVQEP